MTIKLPGRYDVATELARSTLGVMYLAKVMRKSRQIAVKKIGSVAMPQSEKLLRKARAANTLHRHAVIL